MAEEWRSVATFPEYEVSTLGRVRHGERVLNPAPRKTDGYVLISLSLGKRRQHVSRLVHVLVARAFLPNPGNLPVVNHINGQRADNRLENLEWVTVKQNRDKWIAGSTPGRRCRKVVQMTPAGTILHVWDSARAAELAIPGLWNSNLSKCCRGKLPSTAGFKWAYLDDIDGPLPGEEWKDIEVRGRAWEVSSLGRVRTHTGYTTYGAKGGPYLTINGLCAHVLVARAFCPNPDNKTIANHLDGNKQNNSASNLEWCSQAENVRHAVASGLVPQTDKLKKPVTQCLPDGSEITYESGVEAERVTGVSSRCIGRVCRGEGHMAGGFAWRFAPLAVAPAAQGQIEIKDDDPLRAELGLGPELILDDDPLWAELGL